MASMRFKAVRAKKWWLETIKFLNSIRSQHKVHSIHIFDEIDKRKIEPLQLTRISSPETTSRKQRRAYPLSTGCIDFETDENLLRITPPIYDDQFLELQKKLRRRKTRKKKPTFQSLIKLQNK